MKSILEELADRVRFALKEMAIEGDPLIRASQDERFGDYQSNCAMGLAKRLGRKPRELAEDIVGRLRVDDLCDPPEIAGPGFINFRIKASYLRSSLQAVPPAGEGEEDRLGIERTATPQTIVIDLSSPNLAKEMHIGHLRSTVIGDCIGRILAFAGHTVHRENHVGDWGTQFGMLVAYLRRVRPEVVRKPESLEIGDLEAFYVEAKSLFDGDEGFRKESRATVVALQQGDAPTRAIWKAFCDESLRHCHAIYHRLEVQLRDRGESYYTELMKETVRRLEAIREQHDSGERPGDWYVANSEGALCVFMEGFTNPEGNTFPLIVRKTDGGFNYATSDLAAMIHRTEQLHATWIIYVVGIPQKRHFDMVFTAARKVGWVSDRITLQHLAFGSVLNASGKPFKTREGGAVKLKDVLDEAVLRARKVAEADIGKDMLQDSASCEALDRIAETVGIAAVKYFELSHALTSDYRFDFDTMLALEGNTAPYLLYAYARIRSIGRKAGIDWASIPGDGQCACEHPAERSLAKKLLQFSETLETVTRELRPNVLTEYLFELAKTFSRFYDKKLGVRVIDASPEEVRWSRLRLCDLTARTLKLGLRLLGISTLEQM